MKKKLKEAGIRFGMLFPARLIVTQGTNKKIFGSVSEAEVFVNTVIEQDPSWSAAQDFFSMPLPWLKDLNHRSFCLLATFYSRLWVYFQKKKRDIHRPLHLLFVQIIRYALFARKFSDYLS